MPCNKGYPSIDNLYCMCRDKNFYFSMENNNCKRCPDNFQSNQLQHPYECDCDVGKEWEPVTETCHPCGYMKYKTRAMRECEYCPEIAISTTEDRSGCICPPRYGWLQLTEQCELCHQNEYSVGDELGCIECPSDSSSKMGSTQCRCTNGYYWHDHKCQTCQKNTFAHSGDTSCLPCPMGSTSSMGSSHCSCPPGSYWDNNDRSCRNCEVNTYSGGDVFECIPCPTESFSHVGMSHCICPVGTFWDRGTCTLCAKNSYNNEIGKSMCTKCPQESTSEPGSHACTCKTGHVWNQSMCNECEDGKYFISSSMPCHPCPRGTVSLNSTVCVCPPGEHWHAGTCLKCSVGEYKPRNKLTCSICPAGSTSLLGSSKCDCKRGFFWNATAELCTGCSPNTYSLGNSTFCIPCPKKSKTGSNSWACICNRGHIWDYNQCVVCPENTFSDIDKCLPCRKNEVSSEGSGNCVCPQGHFITEDSDCEICSADTYSFGDDSRECKQCPVEATSPSGSVDCICDSGHIWRSEKCQPCDPGYYDNSNDECVRCPKYQTSNSASTTCKTCTYGEYWDNYVCRKCEGESVGNGIDCLPCPANLTKFDNFCVANLDFAIEDIKKDVNKYVRDQVDEYITQIIDHMKSSGLNSSISTSTDLHKLTEALQKSLQNANNGGQQDANVGAVRNDENTSDEEECCDYLHIALMICAATFACLAVVLIAVVWKYKNRRQKTEVEPSVNYVNPIIEIRDTDEVRTVVTKDVSSHQLLATAPELTDADIDAQVADIDDSEFSQ